MKGYEEGEKFLAKAPYSEDLQSEIRTLAKTHSVQVDYKETLSGPFANSSVASVLIESKISLSFKMSPSATMRGKEGLALFESLSKKVL